MAAPTMTITDERAQELLADIGAEQAREWLRKVPYRYKDKYQLTNEELGY